MAVTAGQSGVPTEARWHVLLRPRWLGWHAFVVGATAGMMLLGNWQLHRAETGNELSWAYTFEWPLFSAFTVYFWINSLRDELRLLGHRHLRVTAICPSYIATGLFEGAKPARLTWMLQPDDVAAKVVQAVVRNREMIMIPWTAQLLYSLFRGLPRSWYRRLCSAFGVSRSMAEWKGHGEGDREDKCS